MKKVKSFEIIWYMSDKSPRGEIEQRRIKDI